MTPTCIECGTTIDLPDCETCEGRGCDECDEHGVTDHGEPVDPDDILCHSCARAALMDATRDWYSM